MELPTTQDAVRPKEKQVFSRKKVLSWSGLGVKHILLLILALLFLLPIFWMLSTALKSLDEVQAYPPPFWPQHALWSNFAQALTAVPFFQYIWNTIVIAFFCLIGDVLSSAFIAYAFSCIRFRYRNAIFLLVLATMMVPFEVRLIPQFILFKSLNWIDTFLPLIVPTYFGSPYLIFLLRQSFRGISPEILEAARLDGCNHFTIWWRIVLPLSKPALATVAIFSFMFHWNDFTGPLVFINSNSLYPISLGLSQYTAAYGGTAWNMLMAASLVALLPCIVVFFIAQRYIVRSVAVGGPGSAGK